ncbi:DUF4012 domain-containing protein [Patescibacteria group bacterium]|nr:DUF4012 domain-containing protein [Patescibacteria group bacterium]MBU1721457.1 DUF4012 domain-containing protein [Patescibacteria group bacterium]MBU1900786.1 DUF4012 domain-containing protein [Patescibacteria group bacterium]
MFQRKRDKKRRWPYIVFLAIVLMGIGGFLTYKYLRENIVSNPIIQKQLKQVIGEEHEDIVDQLPSLLGFEEKKTYLLLFLNNTEMRPGGGFIGSYATLEVEKGVPHILMMEGTEGIDGRAPANWKVTPPTILTKELYVDRWYFRDSNWSPDFIQSTKRSLEFYEAEGGVAAKEIDGVIGVTTHVLEAILEKTGPIEVQGLTFNASNVIELLEKEVEYDFQDRGIHFSDRKQIMRPFFDEIIKRVGYNALFDSEEYMALFMDLLKEKQIMIYGVEEAIATMAQEQGWDGSMEKTDGDYLLWADANLAALKTDHAMERHVTYHISKQEEQFIGQASMTYTHTGTFDWRTTRYRTYARIYVPAGSVLQEVEIVDPQGNHIRIDPAQVDQGFEQGKRWFGIFTVIEPGKEEHLIFRYLLDPDIVQQIQSGTYQLTVQKQLGTEAHGLTLLHEFGTTIQGALPAEEEKEWYDNAYTIHTDLREDRYFSVNL